MKLVVISHKRCWKDETSPTGYSTYGGFPLQMEALASLFDETELVLPFVEGPLPAGSGWLQGKDMSVAPLPPPRGAGLGRKLGMLVWLPANIIRLWHTIRRADAVHAPVPGDIGTIGMVLSVLQGKPLFVRHCGNWHKDVSVAQRFIRWFMERYAGKNRLMLATGGDTRPPSQQNDAVRWIFSTSVTEAELRRFARGRTLDDPSNARLIIVCRQDPGKNVDELIRAVAGLRKQFDGLTLDVVGDGTLLSYHRRIAEEEGVSDSVRFHGKLNHDGVMKQLSQSDIFVFPTDSEGFPKSVLEAQAHGLPVISTAVSVIPNLLADGTGVLLKSSKPDSIQTAVQGLLLNPGTYEEMSRKSLLRASEYSLERWAETLRGFMEKAWERPLKKAYSQPRKNPEVPV